MNWDIRLELHQRTMWLSGELTIFSVQDVRNRLAEAFAQLDELRVDLRAVTEIDTAGLQLMLLACRQPGKQVRFCNPSEVVEHLVELANLGRTLGDSGVPPAP